MRRIFNIQETFRVCDGTLVSPFLNAKDAMSNLPFDLLDGFSLAAGEIEPGKTSRIHVMPHVTQVTFVWQGNLEIRMMEPGDDKPYCRELVTGQAALTEPGTFLQFANPSDKSCHVLYIVSPAYVFDEAYDDSIYFEYTWDQPESLHRDVSKQVEAATSLKSRKQAEDRIRLKKNMEIEL